MKQGTNLMKRSYLFFLITIFFLITNANAALPQSSPVLIINTTYKGTVDSAAVKQGKVFILVKPNPSQLLPGQPIFQTAKYNIYTSARREDFANKIAFRKVLAAKFNKDGTIKVYTLANLGYAHLNESESMNGNEIILVNNHGNTIKVGEINLPFVPHPLYREKPSPVAPKS